MTVEELGCCFEGLAFLQGLVFQPAILHLASLGL